MSMLAEPKRKQKWSVDPRNSAWIKDESRFGHKMMERMGWSKGKGLGRTEQGSTDNIKVKVKNDHYGLGTSVGYEDNWIAHQDDFNDLLAQLNNCHGQNSSAEPPPCEEPKGFSLEEKSKTSKKRVHYMKFTKGKDLSSRSETDLNCIFGKRGGKPATQQEQESNSSDSPGETAATFTPAAFELDTESITNTVKSTLTMQEYFAQRMSQLKARGQAQSTAPSMETDEPSDEPGPILLIDDSDEPKKKKKKKKKSKKSADDLEVVEENSTDPPNIVIEDNEDKQQECSGQKKKKRKVVESEGAAEENCGSPSGVEQNCEELPPSKKKKLKKRREETELLNGDGPTEELTVESEGVQKKKKKHREELDDVANEEKEELVENKSKKDKKKKKKHRE